MDKNEVNEQVEKILEELYKKAQAACKEPIEKSVKAHWYRHYRGNFYYAIHYKELKYADAKEELMRKSDDLGKVARRIAGDGNTVTPLHATLASFEVDCPADLFEDWCN